MSICFLAVLEGSLKSANECSISLKRPLLPKRDFVVLPFTPEDAREFSYKVFRLEVRKGEGPLFPVYLVTDEGP